MRPRTTIRWLLTLPSALVGWYIALVVGIAIVTIGDSLCPPELIESGVCGANWYPAFIKSTFVFCASLSAILAVFAGSYMAPSRRALAATVIFLLGSGFAVYFANGGKYYLELIGALLSGLAATLFVIKKSRLTNAA